MIAKKVTLGFITVLIVLLFGKMAYAADTTVTIDDFINGTIKVEGTVPNNSKGETINILVLNPTAPEVSIDKELELAEQNMDMIQYQGYTTTDDKGHYKKIFKLNLTKSVDHGEFIIYVGTQRFTLFFANFAQKVEAMEAIFDMSKVDMANTQEVDKAVGDIKASINEDKKILSIDGETMSAIDLAPLSKKLLIYLQDKEYTFDDVNDQVLANQLVEFKDAILEIAVIECYNQSKPNILFDSTQNIKYDEITKFNKVDVNGITAYSIYSTSITPTGKQKVNTSLLSINANQIVDLQKAFVKNVVINGVINNVSNGSGFVGLSLTKANSDYAGIAIPRYLGLSARDRGIANEKISKNISTINESNFESKIEEYSIITTIINPPGGNSSSSVGDTKITVPVDELLPPTEKFNDISDVEWAKEAILKLNELNIINGTGDGAFRPNDFLKREEFAKILCLAFDLKVDNYDIEFSDVDTSSWYEKFVMTVKNFGIVNGMSETKFGVNENITREDLAVMIYRIMKGTPQDNQEKFADNQDINDYAIEAIYFLKANEIIGGYADNTFKPKSYVTRAEVAKIVYTVLTGENR